MFSRCVLSRASSTHQLLATRQPRFEDSLINKYINVKPFEWTKSCVFIAKTHLLSGDARPDGGSRRCSSSTAGSACPGPGRPPSPWDTLARILWNNLANFLNENFPGASDCHYAGRCSTAGAEADAGREALPIDPGSIYNSHIFISLMVGYILTFYCGISSMNSFPSSSACSPTWPARSRGCCWRSTTPSSSTCLRTRTPSRARCAPKHFFLNSIFGLFSYCDFWFCFS